GRRPAPARLRGAGGLDRPRSARPGDADAEAGRRPGDRRRDAADGRPAARRTAARRAPGSEGALHLGLLGHGADAPGPAAARHGAAPEAVHARPARAPGARAARLDERRARTGAPAAGLM